MENVQGPKDGSQNLEKTLGVASPSTKTEKRLSDRPATADDLLGWLLELSALQGSIGMNGEWDQESFTDAFAMEFDEDGHLSGGLPGDASLSAALGRATCDWAREKYLVEVTGQHHALYPEMLARVDAKLRAGGVPETKIAKMTPKARLIKYASLDRGPAAVGRSPKPPRFFVYVISTKDPTGNIKDHRRLSFPRDVCFGQFLGVLRDMTAYAAERTGHRGGGYMLCDGPWYYNLIDLDNNVVLDAPRMEIVDEESFELMLLQVRNKDTPGISIFHVRVSLSPCRIPLFFLHLFLSLSLPPPPPPPPPEPLFSNQVFPNRPPSRSRTGQLTSPTQNIRACLSNSFQSPSTARAGPSIAREGTSVSISGATAAMTITSTRTASRTSRIRSTGSKSSVAAITCSMTFLTGLLSLGLVLGIGLGMRLGMGLGMGFVHVVEVVPAAVVLVVLDRKGVGMQILDKGLVGKLIPCLCLAS